jgi:hypothetical protein
MRQDSLNGLHSVEFPMHLLGCARARLLVIRDGSPIHRRAAVKEFPRQKGGSRGVGRGAAGIRLDLNPVGAWQHLKHVELRNVTCLDLEELQMQLHIAIGRLR